MAARKKSSEVIASVLSEMQAGVSLRKACEKQDIAASTFMGWLDGDADLSEQYTRAREAMLDRQAEELEDIGERASRAETGAQVAGLRLLADNRKWLLSKLAPKKYGEKLEIEQRTTLTDLSEEQLNARLAKLLAAGG
jgi:hypothetical protein